LFLLPRRHRKAFTCVLFVVGFFFFFFCFFFFFFSFFFFFFFLFGFIEKTKGTRVVYGWRAGDELTAQQEREEIEGAMSLHLASGLKLNQPFFLLSVPWYKAWVEHAHNKASHRPPPISNADLLDDSAAQLRRGLAENYDYMIVNAHVWARFHAW
jgi:hypothetical protein